MKRPVDDIIKDIDGIDSMNKIKELMDALKERKDELMVNDIGRLALIYKKMLSVRQEEFKIINSISNILRKYISGTNIKDITEDDWFALKDLLFPKIPDAYKPVITDEEFDRLYPGDSRHITMTKEMMEADPYYQMLKIALEEKENDSPSI